MNRPRWPIRPACVRAIGVVVSRACGPHPENLPLGYPVGHKLPQQVARGPVTTDHPVDVSQFLVSNRAVFEGIDDNMARIDAAYDHYAQPMQSALDGYADCVLAVAPGPEAFERYAGVLDERASTGTSPNREQFRRKLDELEDRR